jgi:hypothetical protein
MKVLLLRNKSSLAPTRENIPSITPMVAESAGTNEPVWARMAIRAVCRNRVDLPAMLGPVMTCSGLSSAKETVLGLKTFPALSKPSSTVG